MYFSDQLTMIKESATVLHVALISLITNLYLEILLGFKRTRFKLIYLIVKLLVTL